MAFQTVLFDLDGTLIDSVDLIVDSYHHTFRTHSLPMLTREQILAGMGTPLRVVFGQLVEDSDAIDSLVATYREYNLTHHDDRIRAYDGTVEMVRQIAASGIAVGLVTSKNHQGALRGLARVGLEDVMRVVIGADDVTNPKPHCEPALLALSRLGATTDSCLFVGDSLHDMHCGRDAGVKTAGVTWGPFDRAHLEAASPDFICETPQQVVTLALA